MEDDDLFSQLMELIMETSAEDELIDDWVRQIILADNNLVDLEEGYPLTADGSRPRKAKRVDYSRGKKEVKPSEGKVDPEPFLDGACGLQILKYEILHQELESVFVNYFGYLLLFLRLLWLLARVLGTCYLFMDSKTAVANTVFLLKLKFCFP